ncbi:MAG: 30S ribosomal protein S20 [Cystobacterineae bacterium]|nr:30S ribosomal protein S20 [Cystobacterineae bacterium]
MANTRSAQKRHQQSLARYARNKSLRASVRTAVKKAREALASNDLDKAKEAVRSASRALDSAVSKGVLHANNAARNVGRLSQAYAKKAEAPKA